MVSAEMKAQLAELEFYEESKRRIIRALLIAARKELASYRVRKDFVKLVQAAEKAWVAFVNLLELKLGKELHTHAETMTRAMELARAEKMFSRMLDWGEDLHTFHYEPRLRAERVERQIILLTREIRKRL
jgi:hypothetical protein